VKHAVPALVETNQVRQMAEIRYQAGVLSGLICFVAVSRAVADRYGEPDLLTVRRPGCGFDLETRPPQSSEQRGQPWQIWHDWRDPADQKAVIEQAAKQRGVRVSVIHKDVKILFQGETHLAAAHLSDLPPLQRQAPTTTRNVFTPSRFSSSFLPA
jgi:hypothetical protein